MWRFPCAQVLFDADPSLQAVSEEEKNAYLGQGQIRFAFLGFLSLCKSGFYLLIPRFVCVRSIFFHDDDCRNKALKSSINMMITIVKIVIIAL